MRSSGAVLFFSLIFHRAPRRARRTKIRSMALRECGDSCGCVQLILNPPGPLPGVANFEVKFSPGIEARIFSARPGLVVLSFCHRPLRCAFRAYLHGFRHTRHHGRVVPFYHRLNRCETTAINSVFGAPGADVCLLLSCHRHFRCVWEECSSAPLCVSYRPKFET